MSENRTMEDSTSGSNTRLSEIRILMIGGRELGAKEASGKSGKSSAGNIILGRNAFDISRRTARSVQATGDVDGRHRLLLTHQAGGGIILLKLLHSLIDWKL